MSSPSPKVRQFCLEQGFSDRVREGGFEYLLQGWENTVAEVESGYRALFDEYLNDVDGRHITSRLLLLADGNEREMIQSKLPQIDNKFFEATVPTGTCIWGDEAAAREGLDQQRHWWYFRVPQKLDCVEDLENWP
jgi:hypothetical protein